MSSPAAIVVQDACLLLCQNEDLLKMSNLVGVCIRLVGEHSNELLERSHLAIGSNGGPSVASVHQPKALGPVPPVHYKPTDHRRAEGDGHSQNRDKAHAEQDGENGTLAFEEEAIRPKKTAEEGNRNEPQRPMGQVNVGNKLEATQQKHKRQSHDGVSPKERFDERIHVQP